MIEPKAAIDDTVPMNTRIRVQTTALLLAFAVAAVSAQDDPEPAKSERILGFADATAFHRAAGWGSAGFLLAAGAVGVVRALDLQRDGHAYRNSLGIDDEDQISSLCSAKISGLWGADQTLRWVHVGLLSAGETLYLADAVTGIAAIDPSGLTSDRSKLHRWAFFGHAALMAAEIVLGFVTTDAFSRGDHELVASLGVAHAAIGIAIPVVIVGAGLIKTIPE
jgi:hypothetical protein